MLGFKGCDTHTRTSQARSLARLIQRAVNVVPGNVGFLGFRVQGPTICAHTLLGEEGLKRRRVGYFRVPQRRSHLGALGVVETGLLLLMGGLGFDVGRRFEA